ncbi:unnamed protein product [Callosobruchus maculatus]|uniref:GH18 domain-containing protein n=1 Tax=Callosobruchus maculatus TaxID=64391 RepID=A0A653BLS6_CALMS|nr:unnamed protein product [Callosobruchus maculatus]
MGTKLYTTLLVIGLSQLVVSEKVVVCNYEAKAHLRDGLAKFEISDIEPALQYCTHLIYGYAAINDDTLKVMPLNEQFDVIKDNYRKVTDLKKKYPKLKVLLSVGGNEDVSGDGEERNKKYREVVSNFLITLKGNANAANKVVP